VGFSFKPYPESNDAEMKTPLSERRFLQLVPMAGIELTTFALRIGSIPPYRALMNLN
jgi:hypothetical protein